MRSLSIVNFISSDQIIFDLGINNYIWLLPTVGYIACYFDISNNYFDVNMVK